MSQVSDGDPPVSANSPPPENSCVQETSPSRGRHLSLGPRTYNVRDFSDFTTALDEFSRCMDHQTKAIKGWQHFADSLNVPADVIHVCSLCMESSSATIKLFKYLETTKPHMTIGDLCTVLTRNPERARHDLDKMLKDSDLSNECKVSEAITNSTSNIMDKIASKLDSASPSICTWLDVGLEIGIPRDILQQMEKDHTCNPTEELFRCLYTGARNVKASVVVDYLTQMNRWDILEELKEMSQSLEFDSKDAKDIFKLDSKVLERMSRRLNEDSPGVEGWKGLASRFLSDQYIDDRDIISKLEPPHQHEIHSPTKKVIEWLTANKPEVTVNELIQKCREIGRNDAAKILSKHYNVEPSCDEPGSPKSPSPVQETTTAKDNIHMDSSKSFGLPCKPTTKMIGRADKQKELVDEILSGNHRLIVLHAATGYGKERLAVETAYQLIKIEHDYACIYVSSDDILTVEDLAIKILKTCGIPAPSFGEREKVQELFKVVKRKCLLILDNFDHSFHADDTRNDSMDSSTSTTEKPSTPGKSTTGPLMTYESGIVPFGKNHGCAACRESDPTYRNPKHFPWKNTTRKEELQKFIEDVLRFTSNLTILATTWEFFSATVLTKDIQLLPLTWSDSKELFLNMCESEVHGIERSSIPSGLLNSILECCCGIPQLLLNAVVIVKRVGIETCADHLASSTPEQQLKMLCKSRLSPNERFYRCLDICFDRLDSISQKVLMMISVFPAGFFTLDKAASIFKKEVKGGLIDLMNFSFLSYNQERKAYYLSPAMRSFAIYKATHEPPTSSGTDSTDFDATYKAAITQFVCYTFDCTLKIENDFFSTCSADAIRKFREQEANLREIANWFMSDRFPKDPEMKNLKCYIIESFMECYLINIKVMERSLLKTILRTILRFCRDEEGIDSKKKETKKQYVECLTYGGVTCILGCLCVPQLCPIALDQAKWCFDEVLKGLCSNAKTISSYKKQLELVSNCKIMSKGSQTQFLLKYGKCLVRLGLKDEGLEFVENGIKIREKVFKKSKFTKDRVMVAVGYNDLASAYSYNNDSNEKAIQIRITKVLPIYVEHLGCHPFTASALSHLGHDYLVLGSYEKALEACKKALSHRRRLLGEHSETARSLFDMGRILREQAQAGQADPADKKSKLKEALSYLFEALKMHQDLAFTPKETAKNHVEIARVLKSLGREKEAKEHEEKAGDWYMKVDRSHMGEPMDTSTI